MRLPKILGHALVSAALATGGLMLTAGAAHATYSRCLDIVASAGIDPQTPQATFPCAKGAMGDVNGCVQLYPEYNRQFATFVCNEAAVKP
ncbi:hypothetical protein [Streptomyces sp. NPDC004728]|uniref:hypothetical protein n=1 Tax=Streptomyces sp. NPDC004728 TaxID=3154289 RepID=UPI0033B504CE